MLKYNQLEWPFQDRCWLLKYLESQFLTLNPKIDTRWEIGLSCARVKKGSCEVNYGLVKQSFSSSHKYWAKPVNKIIVLSAKWKGIMSIRSKLWSLYQRRMFTPICKVISKYFLKVILELISERLGFQCKWI